MIEFHVPDISCKHCVGTVTQTLMQIDPKATVTIDLPTKQVQVETTESRAVLAAALADAGYPPA